MLLFLIIVSNDKCEKRGRNAPHIPYKVGKFIIFFILYLPFEVIAQQKAFHRYQQKIPNSDQFIDMVPIKGGDFMMGSPVREAKRSEDEGPVHKVHVDAFWMGKFEITWDIYHLFMERQIDALQSTVSKGKEVNIDVDAVSGATAPYVEMSFGMGTDGYPAISMTQLAAAKFCEWLSAITGNFYRLPTEAEWEYACRSGSQEAYNYGNTDAQLEAYAWFAKNSNDKYQKVGLKKSNAWGLYDMHGNVAEWTLDHYLPDSYQKRASRKTSNPWVRPDKTYPRVVRGGSWKDEPENLRSAARQASSKTWKRRDPQIPKSLWWHTDASFVGFRIVRPYKTPPPEVQKKYWGYK